jgi:hypothetical protein
MIVGDYFESQNVPEKEPKVPKRMMADLIGELQRSAAV